MTETTRRAAAIDDPQEKVLPRLTITYRHDAYGSLQGVLLTPEGDALWEHCSSSESYLAYDLTKFADRAAELTRRYPDGFELTIRDSMDPIDRFDPENVTTWNPQGIEVALGLLRREVGRLQVLAARLQAEVVDLRAALEAR